MSKEFYKRKKVVLDFMSDPLYTPMKFREIAMFLRVEKERREDLRDVLDALEEEGKITRTKRGKYVKGEAERISGTYRANAKGFGFVTPEGTSGNEDLYIAEGNALDAMDGDLVEVAMIGFGSGRRREGKILAVKERAFTKTVGLLRIQRGKSYGFVLPDNQKMQQDIFVALDDTMGAKNNEKVVVEFISYVGPGKKPEGKVVEILGTMDTPGVDILSLIKAYDLPLEFPDKVLKQAERVAKPVSEADMLGRKDLRDVRMVTIDGEDAKDLDDAVSLEIVDGNYRLGVHIADVTNYVQENSALDREALKRGTSVYLADRVIPMLPTALSNGMCSLNAGEDRLALSCIMTLDEKGNMLDHEIAETVIHVDRRMTYTSVKKILEDRDAEERERYAHLVPMLENMGGLSRILREKRHQRGAVDFDFPETKLLLDEDGKIQDLIPYERNTATKLIENFMLLANETVAEEYYWMEKPFLYRTHESPDEEKIRDLAIFVNNFGYSMHVGQNEIRPKELQKLLQKVEGSEAEALINRLVLRSMKQARYTAENTGHFGLAAKYYTHFTSPIRRYPDLQIHRIIKDHLRGRLDAEKEAHYHAILDQVAQKSSTRERRAEEAERETIKLKKAEYMKEHLGEVFTGVISGVTNWGLYVELPNTVEGLVHVTSMLDDHYECVEQGREMVGKHTGRTFKLGQQVAVYVMGASTVTRTVDFELA